MRRHHVIAGIAAAFLLTAALLLAGGLWLWALMTALQGGLILLVARKVARPDWSVPPGPAAPPPPAVLARLAEEEELDAIPEPISACPHCGHLGLRAPTLADGGVPGTSELMDKRVCGRCGYQGLAIEFKRREDYRAFLRDLSAGGSATPTG